MSETESYVIILRPAPEYGSQGTDEIVGQHFQYLKKLIDEGKVMMAGRFSEVLIGLIMLEVENRDEAEQIMSMDPAVSANVFHAELYPWTIALRSKP
jgi:uncharacterized protein YciI